jgi:hypothetical protein
MGIRSLRTASISTGAKRSKFWDQTATLAAGWMQIQTQTVPSSGSSTVTFSSISSEYKDLQFVIVCATDRAAAFESLEWTYNSDTTSGNYYAHQFYGDGTSQAAYSSNNYGFQTRLRGVDGGIAGASSSNAFGVQIIDLLDYSNTNKYKTATVIGGVEMGGSGGRVGMASGVWKSTNAISSVTFTMQGGTKFTQNSIFSLYGLKG